MRRPLHHTAGTDGPMFHAVKLAGPQSGMPFDGITYYVVKTAAHGDKRSLPRLRTRLRSGKILDRRNRFLIDCQVYDRSGTGARLRLFADVSLPAKIWLFEDDRRG